MEQMVARKGYWCQKVPHGWNVRMVDCGNGQREILATKRYLYIPQGDTDDSATHVEEVDQSGTLLEAERQARKAEMLRIQSLARAKRNCRWKCKQGEFNELLTLTYRENQTDFALARKHFAAWLRKMHRAIPGFVAVWAFEQQKRGAWHVHVACHRLPMHLAFRGCKVKSFAVATAMWRDVVGFNNGTVNVGGAGGKYQRYRSTARIAGYISKYLTKDHDTGEKSARRWDSTRGLEKPLLAHIQLPEMPFADVISLCFELPEGHDIVRHVAAKGGDMYMLYTEPPP